MIAFAGGDELIGELIFRVGSGRAFERDQPIPLQRNEMAGQTSDQS